LLEAALESTGVLSDPHGPRPRSCLHSHRRRRRLEVLLLGRVHENGCAKSSRQGCILGPPSDSTHAAALW
jgi:hypothetical protein